MTNSKQSQSIGKFLLMIFGIFGVIALVFSVVIALISDFKFLDVLKVAAIVLAIFIAISFLWIYVIEDMWFNKLPDKSQEKVRNWGMGILLISMFILYPMGMFGGDSWSGEGMLNIFPDGASSKNYRVPAEMEVTTKFWWNTEYKIESIEWPNGGRSYFGCTVTKSSNTCTDDDGRSWRVEVEEEPERPSRDDY